MVFVRTRARGQDREESRLDVFYRAVACLGLSLFVRADVLARSSFSAGEMSMNLKRFRF